MSSTNGSFRLAPISKYTKAGRLSLTHEKPVSDLSLTPSDIREALSKKDSLIRSQGHSLKLYERRLASLETNNTVLKEIIGILSSYITDELNAVLPPLPALPAQAPDSPQPRAKNRAHSVDLSAAIGAINASAKLDASVVSSKRFIFDKALQNNLFQDFHEAELLKTIVQAQMARSEMQKVVRFLLGNASQEVFLFKTKTAIFEALSLFLSLRNVAFLNTAEVFLPRALEMMMDVMEVEKITLFGVDGENLYSVAVTAELPQPISVKKNFGHFSSVGDCLIINEAYEDERFDKSYDQVCSFVTRNLACVKVSHQEKVLGILECCNKQSGFNAEDIVLMAQIAKQLALGQVGIEIKENLSSLHRSQAINKEKIESCRQALTIPVLQSIAVAITELVNCERVSIFLYSSASKELVSIISLGFEGTIRIPMNVGVIGQAFISNKTISTDSGNPEFYAEIDKQSGFVTKEILAVPMRNVGVVECLNKKNLTKFSKTDEKRVEVLAEIVRIALEAVNNLGGLLITADINELCVQIVNEAIVHVNGEGIVQKINQAAAEVLKTRPEKIIGANLNEAFENFPEVISEFALCVKEKREKSMKKVQSRKKNYEVSFILVESMEEVPSYLIIISNLR
jgi:PAS domain-containing protein